MISPHGTEHPHGTAHTLYRVNLLNLYVNISDAMGGWIICIIFQFGKGDKMCHKIKAKWKKGLTVSEKIGYLSLKAKVKQFTNGQSGGNVAYQYTRGA